MDKDLERMYQERICRLEEDIAGLRAGRRVMLTLLDQSQQGKQAEISRLLKENQRLSRRAAFYAKALWQSREKQLPAGDKE